MPTIVSFTDSDLLRNKIVPVSWYRLDLKTVSEWSPTKNGDSNNCVIEAVILKDADTGDDANAGVPVTLQFNDKPKARGFIEGFFRALGVDIQANSRYDMQSVAGKQVEAFVENEEYEGRIRNRVNHKYRPLRENA